METPEFIMYAITALDVGVYLGHRDGEPMWSEDDQDNVPAAAPVFEEDHANKIIGELVVAGYKTVEKKEIIPDLQDGEFASSRLCADILFVHDWME